MKKLLLVLLCLPLLILAQTTYVPDDNFEAYLEANGMGNGIANDDYVTTSSIDTVHGLLISNLAIADLTGIENFDSLHILRCSANQLTNLDLSNNTSLERVFCGANQITNINLTNNISLKAIRCGNNPLSSLDLSNNSLLVQLFCRNTLLTELNINNGNTLWVDSFFVTDNPNLYCIEVSNPNYANNNWSTANGNIDPQHYFSNNCAGTGIEENSTTKQLLKVTDLLGRETKQTNQPLFYIYDDGTVEKRIVIE